MIRVVLADDHHLVRQAMEGMLRESRDIEVLGSVDTGERAVAAARRHRPHVVLMDVQMPGIGGIEATRRITQADPGIGVIAVSGRSEGPYPDRMLRSGARGYVPKRAHHDELLQAIHVVSEGRLYICREIAEQLALARDRSEQDPFREVTQRELEVLLRLLNGRVGKDIARELSLSQKTVSAYRKRLLDRIGARNEAELARAAVAYGIIEA